MKKIIFVKCLLMSAGMGLLMGMCFTIINQLKQNGTVQPVGVVIGMLISLVVSMLVGIQYEENLRQNSWGLVAFEHI